MAKGGPHDDGDDDDVVVNSTVDWCCEGERRRAFVGSAAAVAGFLWAGLPRAGPRAHEVLRKGELGCGFRLPKTSRCGTFVTCASGGEVVATTEEEEEEEEAAAESAPALSVASLKSNGIGADGAGTIIACTARPLRGDWRGKERVDRKPPTHAGCPRLTGPRRFTDEGATAAAVADDVESEEEEEK